MATLPQIQAADKDLNTMQNRWGTILNPVINNPANSSRVLKSVALTAGHNVVNHTLGAKLQGWNTVRLRAAATIYDTQDGNPHPELTLWLEASTAVVVDLEVF
jgi:hypothetical protein